MTTPQQQADQLLAEYQASKRGVPSMSDFEQDLEAIRREMDSGEPSDLVQFAEEKVARRVNGVINDLDELCAMASNRETADLVENEKLAIGQMLTRVQLILSFLATRKPYIRRVS